MIEKLENTVNYTFKDRKLLQSALTHRSYSNEKHLEDNYERLEFLGDAVLELTVSNFLFKKFKKIGEGDLTRMRAGIVCEQNLAEAARAIGLGGFIFLGHGESMAGGEDRDSILADVMEAVFGAVYLDGGMAEVERIIIGVLNLSSYSENEINIFIDYKTRLQEKLQQGGKSQLAYFIINESGPDHNKLFTAQVANYDIVLGKGTGKSKKEAEQNAASNALKDMGE